MKISIGKLLILFYFFFLFFAIHLDGWDIVSVRPLSHWKTVVRYGLR